MNRAEIVRSSILTFPHGFSTRNGGVSHGIFTSLNLGMNRGDNEEDVKENWRLFLDSCNITQTDFVCGAQVHGSYVHVAGKENLRPAYGPGQMITADGYVTDKPGVPLAIFTADCVPVLLEDSFNNVIGAVHCGWRSTVADIGGQAVEKMLSLGADTKHIKAAIGPAIDKCCFEVGEEVIAGVDQLLGKSTSRDFYTLKENGKYMLNLRGVVRENLIQKGLLPENIEIVGECTMCHPEKYWSHRYTKGIRGSQASIISM